MISFKSVKVRLTLWYAFVLTLFLSVFAVFMHLELSRALYRDADQTVFNEVKDIEEALAPSLTKLFQGIQIRTQDTFISSSLYYDPLIHNRLMEMIASWERSHKKITKSTKMLRILGIDHKLLVMNLKGWEEEIIFPDFERDSALMEAGESFQTIHFRNRPVRLYYRLIRIRDVPLLVIQGGMSMHEVKNTLQRLAFIILITIPGAVAAACLAGWFLAKRSFQPLDLIIRKAREITGLNIDERLPRTHTGDELDRLAETLNDMMTRIETSTRAIQEFSYDISHELRTPLAIIRGEIDVALRRARTPEALTETLHVIEEEVNELIRLVEDLMLLVRTHAKQLRFEMKDILLTQLLELIGERFQERAHHKNIRLQVQAEKGVNVKGDPTYLKRVFSNLLDNAIKFTQEGGEVSLILEKPGLQSAVVKVIDNGMGIEPEKQSKVFSRFYRTEAARSYEGAGLGLNIAKAICDAHNAEIQLKSSVGQGTTISIFFPLTVVSK